MPGQLPGRAAGALAYDRQQLGEPPLVVGRDGVDAFGQALEAPLVRGQDLLDVQVPYLGQGAQVVLERANGIGALN